MFATLLAMVLYGRRIAWTSLSLLPKIPLMPLWSANNACGKASRVVSPLWKWIHARNCSCDEKGAYSSKTGDCCSCPAASGTSSASEISIFATLSVGAADAIRIGVILLWYRERR